MEGIKRKRVTRVGSGAYSVYLPKKWIDTWPAAQQEAREVDLHHIAGSLLVVPVIQDRSFRAQAPTEVGPLRTLLLSTYVRGYDDVELRAAEPFPNEAVAAARDLLRHLDERIQATVGPDRIAYRVPPDGVQVPDPLQSIGARLGDILELASECLEHAAHDPDRVLHAARLLQAIQEEDVARILHQTLRRVATLDVPIESVSDLQLLDLAAFLLNGVGSQSQALATTVLADLGLRAEDLALPREQLLARLPRRPPAPPVVRDILQGQRAMLREARALLDRLLPALRTSDLTALASVRDAAAQARQDLQARVFDAVVRHWGNDVKPDEAARGFAAYQLGTPLGNVLSSIWACAAQAMLFLAARKPAPAEDARPKAPAVKPQAR